MEKERERGEGCGDGIRRKIYAERGCCFFLFFFFFRTSLNPKASVVRQAGLSVDYLSKYCGVHTLFPQLVLAEKAGLFLFNWQDSSGICFPGTGSFSEIVRYPVGWGADVDAVIQYLFSRYLTSDTYLRKRHSITPVILHVRSEARRAADYPVK